MPTADAENTFLGTFMPAITDPGAGGAIPVTRSGVCTVTTAAAEARTVADASKPGIILAIDFGTDGGDLTVTFASALNQAGNTQAVAADAGDCLTVISTGNGDWRVLANDGYTLS